MEEESLALGSVKSITDADKGVGGGGKSSVSTGDTDLSTLGGGGKSVANLVANPLTHVANASSFIASIDLSFLIELVLFGGGGGFRFDLNVP